MPSDVARLNNRPAGSASAAGAVVYSPWREALGYDPFRRFFSTSDPEINVVRTENGFDAEIPVAGFKPEDIEITVKDDVLTISGKNERRAFTRSLRLPEDIDGDSADAVVEHGMLSLKLSRHPEAQPRKIEIKASRN
ncbi:MAG: Hsp20/alpha crystallin family protein [Candidatus Lustribacter sp.]|jgi:HSP20 family protein